MSSNQNESVGQPEGEALTVADTFMLPNGAVAFDEGLHKKIVIADDSSVSRVLLKHTLENWGFDVTVTQDGNEALEALKAEGSARLAILDWVMPGLDGVEVCRRLRELSHFPYTYVVMLTSMTNKEDLAVAIQAGADDFMSKPFHNQELRARLRSGQRILKLQSALQFQATHDALTGVLNRRAVLDRLEREMARTARQRSSLAVGLIDVDHFKKVNDTYGHLAGDRILKSVVKRISSLLRPYDVIGRYGGEEFLLVLPNCSESQASDIAERLRHGVMVSPVACAPASIPVTISIGITVTTMSGSQEPEQLIHLADEAVYQAKQAGRNRVWRSTNSMPPVSSSLPA